MSRARQLLVGGISRADRTQAIGILILVTIIWRLVPMVRLVRNMEDARGRLAEHAYIHPFTGSGFDLSEFFVNPAVAWVGSPLYLFFAALETQIGSGGGWLLLIQATLSVVLVLTVFFEGERLIGSRPALIAAFLCAASLPLVVASFPLVPVLLFAIGCVVLARQLSDTGRRIEGSSSFRLGLSIGLLTWIQGFASLWLLVALLWFPTLSRQFRGRDGLRVAGLLVAGWMLALSPLLLRGALVQHDLVFPFELGGYDMSRAARLDAVVQDESADFMPYPLGRRERSIHAREMASPESSMRALPRTLGYVGEWGQQWQRDTLGQLYLSVRRVAAFFGGVVGGPVEFGRPQVEGMFKALPAMPGSWAFALAWLGAFALLGSMKTYLPLHAGIVVPLVVAVSTAVAGGQQIVALPFVCMLAGYGLVRWWDSRTWPPTWLLAPAALGLGILWVQRF